MLHVHVGCLAIYTRGVRPLSKDDIIFDVAKFGVVNTIEGLYTLLSDESSPWEKIGGLVQGLTGLGTLMLGLRWLSNPTRLVTDFGNVLVFLYNNLVRGRRGLLGRAGALGLLAGAAYGGYRLYQSFNDDGSGGQPADSANPVRYRKGKPDQFRRRSGDGTAAAKADAQPRES